MSKRPRFLADEDLRAAIRLAAIRIAPGMEFSTVIAMGWGGRSDDQILELAAEHEFITVSHDVNTMTAAAAQRLRRAAPMAGLLVAPQTSPILSIASELVLIWSASEAAEWVGRIEHLPL